MEQTRGRAEFRAAAQTLAAAALFGAATPIAKGLLASIGPLSLAGILYLGAAASVLPAVLRQRPPSVTLLRHNAARLAGVIFLGGVLAPALLLAGLSFARAASVSLWLSLEPLATVLLAWLFFKEDLRGRAWLSAGLVLVASLLLAWPGGSQLGLAALLVALACLCWGLDNNLTSLIDALTPAQTTLIKGAIAGSTNLFAGCLIIGDAPAYRMVGLALLVGALCYGLSLVLYIGSAQQLGAARSQLLFSTAPFWGATLAWTFLAEPVLPVQIASGAMMFVALWILRGERHEHRHSHAAVEHVHWHRHDDGHHDHAHEVPPPAAGHSHVHAHEAKTHAHAHRPDLHHRHDH
ncbi:MAG TPA: DMT family transporter [Candidatus Polarisedimenticolia bacterium]|nr:DMT family transporter [Candidatus Polarisedimenticolia bacterium]